MTVCHVQPIDPSTQRSVLGHGSGGADSGSRPAGRSATEAMDFARGVQRIFAAHTWRGRLVALEHLWQSHGAEAVVPLSTLDLPTDLQLAFAVLDPGAERPVAQLYGLVEALGPRAADVIGALAEIARRQGHPKPGVLVRLAERCAEARVAVAKALADHAHGYEACLLRWLLEADRPLALVVAGWLARHGSAAVLEALAAVRFRITPDLEADAVDALRRAEAEIRVRTCRAAAGRMATICPRIARATFRQPQRPRPLRRSVRRV